MGFIAKWSQSLYFLSHIRAFTNANDMWDAPMKWNKSHGMILIWHKQCIQHIHGQNLQFIKAIIF